MTDSLSSNHRCDGWAWEHNWQDDYYGVKCADCGDFYAYGCEPWAPEPDEEHSDDWYEGDDEPDEFDEAIGNCHSFIEGGYFVCMAAGSEECDECPFNSDLGRAADDVESEHA